MSFIIYPAIDIRDGKCVRLVQGDYNQETVYNENPLEVAQAWEAQGGQWIHLVDLDGAKAGRPVNDKLIGEIARTVKVPVQVGGGLRTEEDVDRLLSLGVSRVILGTAAIEDRAFVQSLLAKHGENVAIGLDARDGYVATRGWLETSSVKAEDLAVQLAEHGAKTFIFTDISGRHDGRPECGGYRTAGQGFGPDGYRFRRRKPSGRPGAACRRGSERCGRRHCRQGALHRQHSAGGSAEAGLGRKACRQSSVFKAYIHASRCSDIKCYRVEGGSQNAG